MKSDQLLSPVRQARRPWRVPGGYKATLGLMAPLFLFSAPAVADIWGYVDAERMPHFAATRLDERYELLLQDSVEPYRRMDAPAKPSNDSQENFAAESAEISTLSPKLRVFFERSENYKAVSPLLREAARVHGIDYSLLKALITTESGFNRYAVSPKGAVGLMQLIPPTAQRYGVTAGKDATIEKKLTDPKINIKAGARYLADLIKMFPGRLELALAAYNAGEGAVQRAGNKIPNYPETQNYVKTVMQLYNGLAPPPFKAANARVRRDAKPGSADATSQMSQLTEPAPRRLRVQFPQE